MADIPAPTPEDAAFIANQQAQYEAEQAAEAARVAALQTECDTSDAGLISRGVAIAAAMTSPGGPWRGLPAEAATNPNHPDWQENCRWACVEGGEQGSFFVATFDGTLNVGDHAENIRGYAHPSKAGYANLNAHPAGQPRLDYALNIGNGLAGCTVSPEFFVAELAGE